MVKGYFPQHWCYVSLLLFSLSVQAGAIALPPAVVWARGNDYQEVFYLTGKPILLSGIWIFGKGRDGDVVDDRYTFRLENQQEEIRLSRTLTSDHQLAAGRAPKVWK